MERSLWRYNPLLRFLIRLVVNAVALYLAALAVPGIRIEGWMALLGAALLFGLVNAFIKPLVSLLTCLIQVVTLGLFTLVLNGLLLWFTAWAAQSLGLSFQIDGFLSAFIGALIVSLVSFLLTRLLP